MKEYTRELVHFLHSLDAGSLPPEVLDRAHYFLLDYLAVTIRGSREESAQAVQRMVQAGAVPLTWIGFASELQCDWAREKTIRGDW